MTTPTEELARDSGLLECIDDFYIERGDYKEQLQAFREAVEAEFSVSTSQWQQLVKSNQKLIDLKVKSEQKLQRRVKELTTLLADILHNGVATGEHREQIKKVLANTQGDKT